MNWRSLPPTKKQIDLINKWLQPIPQTRGEASDFIGKWKDGTKFICKTCNKIQRSKNGIINCCRFKEIIINKYMEKELSKILFDPIVEIWNDETDDWDYEGIPND